MEDADRFTFTVRPWFWFLEWFGVVGVGPPLVIVEEGLLAEVGLGPEPVKLRFRGS